MYELLLRIQVISINNNSGYYVIKSNVIQVIKSYPQRQHQLKRDNTFKLIKGQQVDSLFYTFVKIILFKTFCPATAPGNNYFSFFHSRLQFIA